MDYYTINQVVQQPGNDFSLNALEVVSSFDDANDYINRLNKININKEIVNIIQTIDNPPTDNNMDGYYLVKNIDNNNKYEIYQKQTYVDRGYIYNSINVKIIKHGFLEISHIRINRNRRDSGMIQLVDSPTLNTNSNTDSNTNTGSELTQNNCNLNKHKIDEIQNQLNDKLIKELKSRLLSGSFKRKIE